LAVAPQDASQHRASLRLNVGDPAQRAEVVVVAALDGESLRPMAVQSFALISADNQDAMVGGFDISLELECGPNLVARERALPAFCRLIDLVRFRARGGAVH